MFNFFLVCFVKLFGLKLHKNANTQVNSSPIGSCWLHINFDMYKASGFFSLMQLAHCWMVYIFIIAPLPLSLVFSHIICFYVIFSLFIIYLHVHLSVFLMSIQSGCVVSGLHCGGDDQGECFVPWHWSYPYPHWSTCHHFIMKTSTTIMNASSVMVFYPSHSPWPTLLVLLHPPMKPWSHLEDPGY